MSKYNTRQRQILLAYLRRHVDESLTARRIAADLAGERISLSAVYRNLTELEAEGCLRRTASSGNEARYQFVDAERCRNHIHLTCVRCGKTSHLEDDGTRRLAAEVHRDAGFTVDQAETVLYGVCRDCSAAPASEPTK